MNRVNTLYKRILHLPEGFKMLLSSEQMRETKKMLEAGH
jgi:hypothetical protein